MKAGDGSGYRYDGESMARNGIISVTVNYRLGVFGFLAHPELSRESAHHASGNYGLMDQTEALQWLHKNISVFGGNPDNITIAGESAGSLRCAHKSFPFTQKFIRLAQLVKAVPC
jgi:para-nitrobenzyl esterase